jgi:hypothetical protein
MFYKRNINQYTITDFLLKLSHETWTSVFEGDDVNTVFNAFLNKFLRHYYSSFPVIKANKPLKCNTWMTTSTCMSCHHKREMYMELKTNNNPLLKKNYKDYCRILTTVIKQAKKMDFDKHITNSSNLIKTTWNLIKQRIRHRPKKNMELNH